MCGIVGIAGKTEVAQRLFDGLKRLEYRGYDSAGICTIDGGKLERRRAEGKLDNLARELEADPLHGTVGIAHTRWATHGAPTVGNAHPHKDLIKKLVRMLCGVRFRHRRRGGTHAFTAAPTLPIRR